MCFSAEADFVSGAIIGAIGVATLSQVESPRQVPLAALPLAFALHQVTEGFVWHDLDGGSTHTSGPAVYVYLLFAWVLIPVVVPLAILLLEPNGRTWAAPRRAGRARRDHRGVPLVVAALR